MNIKLRVDLPIGRYKDRISGVYRLTFDNGMFYLGSSCHLRDRASSWRYALAGRTFSQKSIWPSVINKVSDCKEAVFEIVALVERKELMKEEEKAMAAERDNPLMINSILHPKNEIIVKTLQGQELYRFGSMKETANKMGLFQRRVQDVCNGRRYSCRGFIFEYANPHFRKPIIKKSKPFLVFQYDLNGNKVGRI